MERTQSIGLPEAKVDDQRDLGQRLISIHRQAFEGSVEEAAAALQSAIDRCSEVDLLGANFAPLLAASFEVYRPELAGGLLARKFALKHVAVRTRSEIKGDLVLFEKVRQNEISLTFASDLVKIPYLEALMRRIEWVMPLLVRVAASGTVSEGMAFLNMGDSGIAPGLAYSASDGDFFLVPDIDFMALKGYTEFKQKLAKNITNWSERVPVAFWRGATTGLVLDPSLGWRSLQRVGLCELCQRHPNLIDAGFAGSTESTAIVQWSAEAATEIRNSGLVKDYRPAESFHRYRYLVDVDGNSNAWAGLFMKLLTGSPVLKVASPRGYRQWYYNRLRPWHNFVPVEVDMSDLVSKIQWLKQHDAEARAIGENGRALAYSIEYEAELDSAVNTVSAAIRFFSAARSAATYTPTPAGQRKISTYHGTILAYSPASRALVHIAPESNFFEWPLILDGVGGDLYLKTPSGQYVVDIAADGTAKIAAKPALKNGRILRKVEGENAFYTVQINDKYMCAESDGRVTVTREIASMWESFREYQDFYDAGRLIG